MPVSHVGLSVVDVDASSFFYKAALKPLGYRFIGERGGQLGFGVGEADFFISPLAPTPSRPSPIHIAFQAANTYDVRNFYACALHAGGRPAGPPLWRGEDDQIFNAAVHDLEGNTVEVVFHPKDLAASEAPLQDRTDERQGHMNHAATYVESPARNPSSRPRSASCAPRSQACSDTSSSEKPVVPPMAPSYRSTRSHEDRPPSKKFVGTLIGAAASAAALCAMFNIERDSSRKDRAFSDDMLASQRSHRSSRRDSSSHHPLTRARTIYEIDSHTSTVRPRRSSRTATEIAPSSHRPSSHRPRHSTTAIDTTPASHRSRRDSMFSASPKSSTTAKPPSLRTALPEQAEEQVLIRYRRHSSSVPQRDRSPYTRPSAVTQTSQRRTRSRPPPSSTRSSSKRAPPGVPHAEGPKTAPLDMIARSFGGGGRKTRRSKDGYDADTVVPDDSISCVSSRPSRATVPMRRREGARRVTTY